MGALRRLDGIPGRFLSTAGAYGFQLARLVRDVPIVYPGLFVKLLLGTNGLSIEQQAHIGAVGVTDHPDGIAFGIIPNRPGIHRNAPLPRMLDGIGADVHHRAIGPEGLAIVTARLDKATEVEQSGIEAARRPAAGLAEVVDACPQKLAENMLVITHGLPCGQVVAVFAAIDDAVGIALVVFVVPAFGIVVAGNIK